MNTRTLPTQNLLEIPYEKRKYLYVVDENRMNEFTKATDEFNSIKSKMNKENLNPFEWMGLGLDLISAQANVMGNAGDLHNVEGVLTWSDIFKSEEEKKYTFTAVKNYISGVIFPGDGIPFADTTYICNPISKKHYYLVEDFYKQMLDFKRKETIDLLTALGATEINIVVKEETKTNFDFNINIFDNQYSTNNNVTSKNKYYENDHIEIDPSDKPPYIPKDIYSINYEPRLRTIAEQRVNGTRIKSFEIKITNSGDLKINSEINALIKGIKGSANVIYNELKNTYLSLSGKFS